MVRNPFQSLRTKKPSGFIYLAGERQDPRFTTAQPGEVIRNPTREAPWIVVEHALHDVLITHWPGTLWEAEVLEALQPQGHTGNYTRAIAVRLVRRVPPHSMFGPNGEAIAWIADRTMSLTREEAVTLSGARSPLAAALYSRAWLNWEGLAPENRDYDDWEGVIAAGQDAPISPVHRGLGAIFNVVMTRAMEVDGDAATIEEQDDDTDPDIHLVEPWATASLALLEAAMALGAPDLLTPEERGLLTRPWHALTGPSLS